MAYAARREGLAPLVHATVRAAGARTPGPDEPEPPPELAMVPWEVSAELAAAYAASAGAASALYDQLAAVIDGLRAAGISALVLKGAALARGVYQDPALRPFSDLDLLVHPGDIDRVHLMLTGLGYDIRQGAPSDADRTWRHGRGYFDPARRRVPVDVHWRYAGYPLMIPIDYEEVFTRALPFAVDGRAAAMPAGADMVVALSVHFLRDLWYGKTRVRYLRDIAEVSGREEVDWERLPRLVEASPLLRSPLFLALGAAAALLGAPVPVETLAVLRPGRWGVISRMLLARMSRRIMRADRPLAAVGQVAVMRGLDAGIVNLARWLWTLLAVPRPLAPSQRRWLRYLTGGPFRGTPPAD